MRRWPCRQGEDQLVLQCVARHQRPLREAVALGAVGTGGRVAGCGQRQALELEGAPLLLLGAGGRVLAAAVLGDAHGHGGAGQTPTTCSTTNKFDWWLSIDN